MTNPKKNHAQSVQESKKRGQEKYQELIASANHDGQIVYYEDPDLEFLGAAQTPSIEGSPVDLGELTSVPSLGIDEVHARIEDAFSVTPEEMEEKRELRKRLKELS